MAVRPDRDKRAADRLAVEEERADCHLGRRVGGRGGAEQAGRQGQRERTGAKRRGEAKHDPAINGRRPRLLPQALAAEILGISVRTLRNKLQEYRQGEPP